MYKSQQNNLNKNRSVDRRTMIKGAVALGLTAAIPICAKAADNQFNQEPQEQDTDKENNEEYHLYSLIPSETVPFDGTLRPAPMFVNWSNHSEDLDEINDIGFRFVVWATAEQATALNESDQIESLSMICLLYTSPSPRDS